MTGGQVYCATRRPQTHLPTQEPGPGKDSFHHARAFKKTVQFGWKGLNIDGIPGRQGLQIVIVVIILVIAVIVNVNVKNLFNYVDIYALLSLS